MALRRNCLSSPGETEGGLSKREQRKLELTLKHFPGVNNPKPNKKRKGNDKDIRIFPLAEAGKTSKEGQSRREEPEIFAETKQQSQLNSTPTRQPTAEVGKSPLIEESARKEEQPSKKDGFINSEYPLAGHSTIVDFLAQYQFRQMEKSYTKEGDGFEDLDKGGELKVTKNGISEGLMRRINNLLADYRKALDRRPFSKAHLTLSKAISKEAK